MMILSGTLGLHTTLLLGLIFTVWFYADELASWKLRKKLEQVDRRMQLKTGEGIPQQKSDNSISTSLNIDKFLATKDSRFDLSDTPWSAVNMKSPTANEDYSASTSSKFKSKVCDAVMTPTESVFSQKSSRAAGSNWYSPRIQTGGVVSNKTKASATEDK
ncbi:hypothetical protein AUEXF2481DRAFT_5036 [Aureobasidium subglaciale EXF-2481]|uniref:Uncharacterized protein n=1 Tax=Aureobasidium subglaciale (strain EXF-2481) TaxID=1043005 RepID=A0A074Z9C5_AURSE|nr:uncharacterized protein AUEXF2481DRAFT_5036 [Aureobasidium subglaciale EXF-2481]KAI5204896.1 hypothetical protein E4T38_04459 [Aureobasidium subglaciale]KAI5223842.1 hypothetical protein E4T40_04235 [Aureobasidium subglaciale]KAI5227474.1 hypothetical protein E4T41_04317 [Aureobasidium subglaciale]KAI5262667.1 hypothetical protein E4T46_04203 [Aureobasidium subglaciale]KEQ95431.1 hypothetical protein AUEXF2481DRAFT_5036 [Aureobasidium subglaciale EXF-2481]